MKKTSAGLQSLELLLFSLIIGGVNLFFRTNPGVIGWFFNPYFFLGFVAAAYYGKYYGLLSLFFSALVIFILLPIALELVYFKNWNLNFWQYQHQKALIPLALSSAGVYLFGIIRDSFLFVIHRDKEKLRRISREKGIMQKRLRGVEKVNHELEERVLRQQDSITELFNRIQKLYALSFTKALFTTLETIHKFSRASKASIWEFVPDAKELRLAANFGWESKVDSITVLSVENTIEGWVVRNNLPFSIKMLNQYENFQSMDAKRNIITLPITVGRKTWGILNIEEMPFEKYNLYTEEILQLILSLSGPPLEKALDYESVIQQAETNHYTGLPSFSQFYSLLEKEIERLAVQKGTLSIVIMEILNLEDLFNSFGVEKAYKVIVSMLEDIKSISSNKANIFHYKSENQLALLIPNMDYDGASLLCFEIVAAINVKNWKIDDTYFGMETVFGYAAIGEKKVGAENLIEIAENLIEMQKL